MKSHHPSFPLSVLPKGFSLFRTDAGWHLKTGPEHYDQSFICSGALDPNILAERLEDYGEPECAKTWKRTPAELASEDLVVAIKLAFHAMDDAKSYFKEMGIPSQLHALQHAMDIADRALLKSEGVAFSVKS